MATILFRDFPDQLLEECKKVSNRDVSTKAVLRTLSILFREHEEFRKLQHDNGVLLGRYECLLNGCRALKSGQKIFDENLNRASDPDSFFLAGDVVNFNDKGR